MPRNVSGCDHRSLELFEITIHSVALPENMTLKKQNLMVSQVMFPIKIAVQCCKYLISRFRNTNINRIYG